jgi:hypothetical protein
MAVLACFTDYFLSSEHLDSAIVVKACSPGILAMVL